MDPEYVPPSAVMVTEPDASKSPLLLYRVQLITTLATSVSSTTEPLTSIGSFLSSVPEGGSMRAISGPDVSATVVVVVEVVAPAVVEDVVVELSVVEEVEEDEEVLLVLDVLEMLVFVDDEDEDELEDVEEVVVVVVVVEVSVAVVPVAGGGASARFLGMTSDVRVRVIFPSRDLTVRSIFIFRILPGDVVTLLEAS